MYSETLSKNETLQNKTVSPRAMYKHKVKNAREFGILITGHIKALTHPLVWDIDFKENLLDIVANTRIEQSPSHFYKELNDSVFDLVVESAISATHTKYSCLDFFYRCEIASLFSDAMIWWGGLPDSNEEPGPRSAKSSDHP